MCTPRSPEVLGKPRQPSSSSTSRRLAGDPHRVGEVGARLRVEVDAQLVRVVDVVATHRPGVEGDGAEVARTTRRPPARSAHTSSAVRPLGKAMCAVSTQSGAPLRHPLLVERVARGSARVASLTPSMHARPASAPASSAGRAARAGCRRRPPGSSSTRSSLRDPGVREVQLVGVGDLDGPLPDLDLHEG